MGVEGDRPQVGGRVHKADAGRRPFDLGKYLCHSQAIGRGGRDRRGLPGLQGDGQSCCIDAHGRRIARLPVRGLCPLQGQAIEVNVIRHQLYGITDRRQDVVCPFPPLRRREHHARLHGECQARRHRVSLHGDGGGPARDCRDHST